MTELSTTITGTIALADKEIALASRIALYEQRTLTLTASDGTFPTGTYRLQVNFGARVVATAALTAATSTLTGTLNLSTTQMEALFDVLPVNRLACKMLVYDSAGKVLWGRSSVDVWRNEYTTESATPVPARCTFFQGIADITEGASSVTIDLSGESVDAGASIAGVVLVPVGSVNIFIVGTRLSTTAAVFTLSSAVGAGYKLSWMVAQ